MSHEFLDMPLKRYDQALTLLVQIRFRSAYNLIEYNVYEIADSHYYSEIKFYTNSMSYTSKRMIYHLKLEPLKSFGRNKKSYEIIKHCIKSFRAHIKD